LKEVLVSLRKLEEDYVMPETRKMSIWEPEAAKPR
jgi:hypothetical protein